ncbi:type II toxin-antitoxin system RelE/ParE family toxin [Gordonibacter urolithinfaciens]|uniref:Type II toxin-antitoxin system RelE/ParE family toxin n=1 Tax=Gordonibacter urolithinfaciens TaxID=1335613 RepID=A0A6N8IJ21_9ACTN|nr:type II toxin-antitoxin system RelE/ParE family toxin [Gordonibacter urolithinfaciens]MCB6561876.1 type II toxin-antitoxin system RelE/ParE family toxin [Gordonibacter urolithinfaciens]MVM55407.1 type II toxin-antitoxin system RelE/ParE family toxin [Gordonibacter urolithinfaciens]MVN15825.1 type II toxin-antitoxin system RelE/ParE family toxin [Gordonibacter urolithinfaciens]MVN39157.1 type II toxin-antitoxin system RelE/ParE family toxin [Gordonibacter urolithinfaciens]MVN56347.1 type II 
MREIEFRPRASADLDGILAYIALTLKSPQAARDTANAIFASIERAAEMPELGQPFFDEDLEHPAYRRKLVKRSWVYYTCTDDTLTVRRIFHTTQDTDCYGFELLDD